MSERYSTLLHTELDVTVLPYYPDITASAYSVVRAVKDLSIIPSCQYVGARWADGMAETELEGYFLFNLKAEYIFNSRFSVSLSANNIFDTLYEIRAYFPMPGRSYEVSARAVY